MIDYAAVEEGFACNEFFVEYLPTVSLVDGRCVGAEALTRWRHASGLLMPAAFITRVENTPLSGRMTYWVIDTMAAELSPWLRANPNVHVSINVPPEILGRGGLVYALEKSGLIEFAHQLVFEITERGVPDLLGLKALDAYPATGIRLALDDVNLSGANLAILTRCPFSIIKIDLSLVQQIRPENPCPEWLQGIAPLLQATQLDVIAEGVETEFQAAALKASGVTFAQGFYFARPISAAGLTEFHTRSTAGAA